MADLKTGSTVGGSHIWTQGNLQLQPAQDSLFYKGHKVFTTHDLPTPEEVDAVSATRGGAYLEMVHFEKGLSVGSASAGDTRKNGIFKGGRDDASYNGVSWELRSWKSIGFVNARDNTIMGYIDTTTGDFYTKGDVKARQVFDSEHRVYSPANKPTNDDLDLVSRHGDTVAGDFHFNDSTINLDNTSKITGNGHDVVSLNDLELILGSTGTNLILTTLEQIKLRQGGAEGTFYTTLNKPTNADVGLGRVTNDAQVKKEGDRMTGNLQAPKVILENDPTTPNEAVRLSFLKDKFPFPQTDVIGAARDWNTITDRGVYKVTDGSGQNKPTTDVTSGVLVVDKADDGSIVQCYYPKVGDGAISIRTKDGQNWQAWRYVMDRALADARYVNVNGDTMTSTLRVIANGGVRTVDRVVGPETRSIAMVDSGWGTGLFRYSNQKKGQGIVIGDDDQLYFYQHTNSGDTSLKNDVFHRNNKPTAQDVQAVPLNAVIDFGTY